MSHNRKVKFYGSASLRMLIGLRCWLYHTAGGIFLPQSDLPFRSFSTSWTLYMICYIWYMRQPVREKGRNGSQVSADIFSHIYCHRPLCVFSQWYPFTSSLLSLLIYKIDLIIITFNWTSYGRPIQRSLHCLTCAVGFCLYTFEEPTRPEFTVFCLFTSWIIIYFVFWKHVFCLQYFLRCTPP